MCRERCILLLQLVCSCVVVLPCGLRSSLAPRRRSGWLVFLLTADKVNTVRIFWSLAQEHNTQHMTHNTTQHDTVGKHLLIRSVMRYFTQLEP